MRIIFKVSQSELRNLFFSPIAWFVIIVFYVVIALCLTMPMEGLVRVQEVHIETYKAFPGFNFGMMGLIFNPISGGILSLVYLFIPLLTMGSINREVTSGTMKLLYSSPIRIIDILIGKYLALVVLNIVLLVAVGLIFATGYFTVLGPESRWFLAILLGFFLLLNTYAAIGVFISCLTGYQIVAAVATFAVFFIFSVVSKIWQQYDFFRDITFFLSMSGKAESMLMGLITSRDVCYFLLITILFLGFSLIKLRSTQEKRPALVVFSRYIGMFLVVVCFGYISSKPANVGYLDVTNNKINTIVPPVQEIIREMDGSPLKVTLYSNLFGGDAEAFPQNRHGYTWGFWEQYRRFYPNLELDYVYYYDVKDGDSSIYKRFPDKSIEEIVDVVAEMLNIRTSLFIRPEEIRRIIDFGDEDLGTTMVVEYKNRKEFLRKHGTGWPKQSNVAGVLKRLTRKKDVNIGFLTGHLERSPWVISDRNYTAHLTDKAAENAAINLGFDTDTISILQQDIPADLNLLVVADPKTDFQEIEKERIGMFLNQGGNALFFVEPGKQAILNPILNLLGVKAEDGTVVRPGEHEMPHFVAGVVTNAGCSLAKESALVENLELGVNGTNLIVGGSHLSYESINGFNAEPIIVNNNEGGTWLENGLLVVDSAAPTYSVAEGDIMKDQYVLGLKLTRKINNKEQRIIIVGDADLLSNRRYGSGQFGLAFYSWGLYNEYPVYAEYPRPTDNKFSIVSKQVVWIKYVFVYLIPAILLLTAIILLIRRKKK